MYEQLVTCTLLICLLFLLIHDDYCAIPRVVCWVICGNLSVVGVEWRGREGTVPDSPCSFPCSPQFIRFIKRPQRTLIVVSHFKSSYLAVLHILTPTCAHTRTHKYACTHTHIHTHKYAHIHIHTHHVRTLCT